MALDSARIARITGNAILVFATVVLGLQHAWLPTPDTPERLARDLAQRVGLSKAPSLDPITVITVDDASLLRLGARWPLERSTWAQVIKRLRVHKPAVIAIDAWFEGPAPQPHVELARTLAEEILDGADAETAAGKRLANRLNTVADALDGDSQLATEIAEATNVVLGAACVGAEDDTFREANTTPIRPVKVAKGTAHPLTECDRISSNLTTLGMAARGQGLLDILKDGDGRARRYDYLKAFGEHTYPSLAYEAVRLSAPGPWLERVTALPLATSHILPQPPEAFRRLSLIDVLEMGRDDSVLQGAIQGKVVFVGVSAEGTRDLVSTPVSGPIPGVFFHAAAAATALAGAWDQATEGHRWVTTVGGALLFGLLGLLGGPLASLRGILALGLTALSLWVLVAAYFLSDGVWTPSATILCGVLAWMIVRGAGLYWSALADRRRAAHIRKVFQHYLAPEVVSDLIAHPEKLSLGGERCEITAFFADMQGFTSLSEELAPDALAELLNRCLGDMSAIIVEEGGVIDKYVGDAIVAMFGAPVAHLDHHQRAARAAVRCQAAVTEMGPWLAEQGLPPINVRIGLNSGPAVVGNMGSEHRFDYTMLGDAVNYAARLESANKLYGTRILLGESTAAAVSDLMLTRELDDFQARGKTAKAPIYELLGGLTAQTPKQAELCRAYAEALNALRGDRIEEAHDQFTLLAADGDGPARFHLDRIDALYGEGYSQT